VACIIPILIGSSPAILGSMDAHETQFAFVRTTQAVG
jgi:hypothetical protein